ncbi:hypothetical protein DITRI_Ditri09bG0039400 [Diplodiscus trichospermus]
MCEAFNSSILEARHKSIITMLDEIRVKIMCRIVEKRAFCEKWNNDYGPLVKKKFDAQKKEGVEWRVHWNGDNGIEVKKGRRQYVVNLKKKECSCRLWQISGIPCAHACCAIWHDEGNPDEFLHRCYSSQSYLKAYQYALQPINGSHEWKKIELEPMLPPSARKMPGRPKKNRRKAKDEPKKSSTVEQLSRIGRIMTCSICGIEGHNKLGCSQNKTTTREGPSQVRGKGKQKVNHDQTFAVNTTKSSTKAKGKGKVTRLPKVDKGKQNSTEPSGTKPGIKIVEASGITSSDTTGTSRKRKAFVDPVGTQQSQLKRK